MRFADPAVCPSCASSIRGMSTCSTCGFDLTSPAARELWQTLLQADSLLEKARTSAEPAAAAQQDPVPEAATAPSTMPLPKAPPTVDRPVRRTISTGSILLGLGALFILVAGVIFVSVSWGSLGVVGRALVLLAFTALVGVLASWVTQQRLRASSEALWTVFLGLLTVDWFAAWDQGLFGLDALSPVASAAGWSTVMFAAGSYVVAWAGPKLVGIQLVAPMTVAGVAPWVGGIAIAVELFDDADWNPFWSGVGATAFVLVFLLVALRLKHRLTSILLAAAGGAGAIFLATTALIEAFDHPSAEQLFSDRHALPLLVVVSATIAAGFIDRRAATPTTGLAVLGLTTLAALPVETAHEGRGAMLVLALIVVLGALVLRRVDPWSMGARAATALLAVGLALATWPWIATVGSLVDQSFDLSDGAQSFWSRPSGTEPGSGPWWLALIVFAALGVALTLARWWPETEPARDWLIPAGLATIGAGSVIALARAEAPFTVTAVALIVLGAVLSEVPPRAHRAWGLVGPAVVALAPVVPLPSRSATLVVWLVSAAVLVLIARRASAEWQREATTFAAAGWGLGAAGVAISLVDQSDRPIALSLVVAAGLGLAVASFPMRAIAGRRGVETGAALVAVVGLGIAGGGDVSLGWVAAIWTVLGASVSLISLFTPDRPYFRWVGFGALGVAYVLRLVASDVETVEAYTLPFGVVLVCAGLWWMRGRAEVGTVRALGSGLLLILLPSLPLALDEPTGLRALLLGVGAFFALAVGAGKKWQAPFVLGAVILVLLVIVNLGPLAVGLPRWVLIATAGALLLGAGVTWEARVRNGRAVATYVASMR